jgi:hypothetical protein
MTSVLDKRVNVEGAITDDIVYGDKGQILKPIAPKNHKEEKQIEEMMQKYPQLDYLMCLLLIQATQEELEEITKNPKPRQLDTSTIIKQDFYLEEEPNLNNLVIS